MDVDMKPDILACNMGVFTPEQRNEHIRATGELFQKVENIRQTENGYEFILPNQTDVITKLGDFISNERLCCPFLEFTLKVAAQDEPISLVLTGPEGTQEFLREEFSEAFA
jgi:hypothetical protein